MTHRLSIRLIGGPLPAPTSNANARWSERWSLELRAEDDTGVGLGEAAPLPGYSDDSALEVAGAVSSLPTNEGWDRALDAVPTHLPSLRFALETAIRTLRAERIPARPIARCGLVDIEGHCSDWDAPALKLKVGANWVRERALLEELREHYPSKALRIDGNQRWSGRELEERYGELIELDLELVEELVPGDELALLDELELPYALDESLRQPELRSQILGLLDRGRIKALVLKPTVLGGLAPCEDWASRAFDHGAHAIASHCFEGPIGSAAVAELAYWLAERGEGLAMGIGPHACSSAYEESAS